MMQEAMVWLVYSLSMTCPRFRLLSLKYINPIGNFLSGCAESLVVSFQHQVGGHSCLIFANRFFFPQKNVFSLFPC